MDKKFIIRFITYWTVNALILALANSFFPADFIFGNAYLNLPAAVIFSGFLLTVILWLAKGLAKTLSLTKKGRYFMFAYYWGSASFGVWLVARVAPVSGFGLTRFTWALGCGVAVALTNWLLRQALKGIKLV